MTTDVPANDTEGPAHERRRVPRSRVRLTGKLHYPQRDRTVDCTVSDLSEKGAQIQMLDEDWVRGPYLLIVKRSVVHGVIPIWRLGANAGLWFAETMSMTGDAPAQLRGLQRLWMELRRREADLVDRPNR